MVFVEERAEAKVDDLEGGVVGLGEKEEVLGLEIAMADSVRVAVVERLR